MGEGGRDVEGRDEGKERRGRDREEGREEEREGGRLKFTSCTLAKLLPCLLIYKLVQSKRVKEAWPSRSTS